MCHLELYLCTLLAFLAIDMVWLGLVARGFYREHLGYLLFVAGPQVTAGRGESDRPAPVYVIKMLPRCQIE